MFGFHIRNHPILKKCHSDMIRQMTAGMRTIIFFTGDYLVFEGDIDECMYFIHQGEVSVLSLDTQKSETISTTLKEGDMFGLEQGIYRRCGHIHTYRADTYCVVVTLKRKEWIHLLDFFPASKYLVFDSNYESRLLGDLKMNPRETLKPNLPCPTGVTKVILDINLLGFYKILYLV